MNDSYIILNNVTFSVQLSGYYAPARGGGFKDTYIFLSVPIMNYYHGSSLPALTNHLFHNVHVLIQLKLQLLE